MYSLRRWRRSRWIYWVTIGVLAAVTYQVADHEVGQIAESKRRFGSTVRVLVVNDRHPAGTALTDDDVHRVEVPSSVAPDGRITDLDETARLRVDVGAGEILVGSRFTSSPTSPTAAAIPTGSVGLAIPLPSAHLELTPGDVVDLVAITSRGLSDTIVDSALVIDTEDVAVTVAVPETRVGVVADATLAGTVTIALRGPTT